MALKFNFGEALAAVKAGGRAMRQGWNGRGMWIALMPVTEHGGMDREYLYMRAVDGQFVPWVASQTDLLAEDWEVVA